MGSHLDIGHYAVGLHFIGIGHDISKRRQDELGFRCLGSVNLDVFSWNLDDSCMFGFLFLARNLSNNSIEQVKLMAGIYLSNAGIWIFAEFIQMRFKLDNFKKGSTPLAGDHKTE